MVEFLLHSLPPSLLSSWSCSACQSLRFTKEEWVTSEIWQNVESSNLRWSESNAPNHLSFLLAFQIRSDKCVVMKKVYSADKESEETRLRLWKPHDPASHAATLASSRFQQSGWTRTSQNLCLLYIWSILHSPWDDQWPESEVWEMIVNSPARAINNNLGSDFTSNSNRLHQSLAHC